VQIHYRVSSEFIKRTFVNDGKQVSPTQVLEVDPAELTADQRGALVRVDARGVDQSVTLRVPYWGTLGTSQKDFEAERIYTDAGELLAAWVIARDVGQAQVDEKLDEKIAKDIERLLAWDNTKPPQYPGNEYRDHPRRDEYLAANATARERAEELAQEARERESEREAAHQYQKEQAEIEKRTWIEQHGSDFLRKACLQAGHDCQRRYAIERAALEYPGYTVDFDDAAGWKARACPGEMALDEALAVGGDVVWLTSRPSAEVGDWPEEEYWEPCEAVVIQKYLGRYDLVREF
jgi:hypothetical protein